MESRVRASNLYFIHVEDDPSHNLLCKAIIKRTFKNANVNSFLYPEEALEFIGNEFNDRKKKEPVTLFLDINMPSMTGWEFLEKFKKFPKHIRKNFDIHLLTSSVEDSDHHRAASNELVSSFILKPLRPETLKILFALD